MESGKNICLAQINCCHSVNPQPADPVCLPIVHGSVARDGESQLVNDLSPFHGPDRAAGSLHLTGHHGLIGQCIGELAEETVRGSQASVEHIVDNEVVIEEGDRRGQRQEEDAAAEQGKGELHLNYLGSRRRLTT